MRIFKGRTTPSTPESMAAAERLRGVVGRGQAEVYPSPPMIDLDVLHGVQRLFWSPDELAQGGEA